MYSKRVVCLCVPHGPVRENHGGDVHTQELGTMHPHGRRTPRSDVDFDEDEVTISDLRPITSGGTSSSLPQFGAGEVMPHPDLAGEGGKRSTRTPVKQTPNARPRARARTEEWSNLQSGRLHGDSGGRSAVTSGHPSETSSAFIRCTGRVPSVASDSGERAIVRRHLPVLQRRHRLSRLESMGNYGPLLAEHSVICACRRTGRGNLTATC
ncbi:unnamed protein product [Ascophyllum nodosum]